MTLNSNWSFTDAAMMTTPLLNVTTVDNTSVWTIAVSSQEESSSGLTVDTYKKFAFAINIIVIPILCTFGIIFNGLGLGVIWPDIRQQKWSIYTYLCALTLSDMIYLAIGLIRTIPTIMKTLSVENAEYVEEHMKRWTIYLDMVFSHTSVAIIIVMSFERMIALVRPLQVKRTWFAKFPVGIIMSSFLINVIFLLPFVVYLEVASFQKGNETKYFIRFNPDIEADMDRYMIAQTVVDYIIPAICLLVTNITIPIKYYQVTKHRLTKFNVTPGSFNNRQLKITSTVFAITVMYFLLSVPNLSIKMLGFIDEEYSFDGKHKLVFWFAIDLSNLFFYINAANDCVIYILVSDYYRKVFRRKYCGCCIPDVSYAEENGDMSSKAGYQTSSTPMNGDMSSKSGYQTSSPSICRY